MEKNDTGPSNRKKLSSGLLPKSTAGWLFLLFFISAWMFFLGILTGRGTAPVKFDIDKLQKELAALKAADIEKQMNRVKISSESTKMKTGLGFYEDLKNTKEPAKSDHRSKTDLKISKQKGLAQDTASKTKKKSTVVKSPDSGSSTKEIDASLSKIPDTEKDLTIQAASFRDPEDAEQIVAKLREKGYPAYKSIGVVPEKGIWYRVRIGHYDSKADADSTLKKLKRDGYDAFLVTR